MESGGKPWGDLVTLEHKKRPFVVVCCYTLAKWSHVSERNASTPTPQTESKTSEIEGLLGWGTLLMLSGGAGATQSKRCILHGHWKANDMVVVHQQISRMTYQRNQDAGQDRGSCQSEIGTERSDSKRGSLLGSRLRWWVWLKRVELWQGWREAAI